jgi:hypothetical protein
MAYSASILNPAMDEYNPCNQINLKQDESKKLPNFACGTCISKDIVICKFCKPATLPGDLIDVQVYPNPIKFGGIINVVMIIKSIKIILQIYKSWIIITGDRILGIEKHPLYWDREVFNKLIWKKHRMGYINWLRHHPLVQGSLLISSSIKENSLLY